MEQSKLTGGESELVAEVRAGDVKSFEALVNLYERRIYHIAYRIVESVQDAEDVLQETFLKAFKNLQGFRGESSFYTWIVQIAVNAALQRVNRQRKHPTVSWTMPAKMRPVSGRRRLLFGKRIPRKFILKGKPEEF